MRVSPLPVNDPGIVHIVFSVRFLFAVLGPAKQATGKLRELTESETW